MKSIQIDIFHTHFGKFKNGTFGYSQMKLDFRENRTEQIRGKKNKQITCWKRCRNQFIQKFGKRSGRQMCNNVRKRICYNQGQDDDDKL